MYNRIILAVLFYFAVLKVHVASKNLEQTTYANKLLAKKFANVEASPQSYLILAEQRFALNSEDAIKTSYYLERLEIRPQS